MFRDPLCLFFRVWLYPESNPAAWEHLRTQLHKQFDDTILWSYEDSFKYLYSLCNRAYFETDNVQLEGLMGGLEEQVLRFFVGEKLDDQPIIAGRYKVSKICNMSHISLFSLFKSSISGWFDFREEETVKANPYVLMQYLLEEWHEKLLSLKNAYIEEDDGRGYAIFFKNILKFSEDENADAPRREMAKKLRYIFENTPLPDKIQDWWQQISETGRIKKYKPNLPK